MYDETKENLTMTLLQLRNQKQMFSAYGNEESNDEANSDNELGAPIHDETSETIEESVKKLKNITFKLPASK